MKPQEQKAIKQLSKLGFKFDPPDGIFKLSGHFGTIKAEPYDLRPDHFTPKMRDVFFAKAKGGWYVTSHIYGTIRHYRCRNTDETTVANIFGLGKTLPKAIADFKTNFTSKTYNVRRG